MRIDERRADRIRLRSDDTSPALFWAAALLALAFAIAIALAIGRPERPTGYVVAIIFCVVAGALQVRGARTLRVELSRHGPSRWTETSSLIRRRETTFEPGAVIGLRISTGRRFRKWGNSPHSTHPGPTITPVVRSTLTAVLSNARSVELGWTRGLGRSERQLREDAEQIAAVLGVPVQQ